ncbi:hypothetical protein [Mycoplasma marinum]|uniref:Uncharacterized protein n=1 Tax=Mycoplasma marinum TaxID=1937190 RepID=A0A4R0XMP9_9MOLU|nr:hypothetical protein [Mycoplasma marinum]TCG11991.1 hypothetical protein C4B24_00040 [Mycoplasma marinum]
MVGENTHIFAGTGDCTGNIYVKVKATANNEIGGANSIVGKNYSKEQIEAELKKVSTWKNPSTPNNVIKKTTTEEAAKGSLKNILVGRVVVANDGKISPSDKVYFDGTAQNEELIEKSKTFVKSRTHNFMHVKNGVILNKKEFKKKMLNDLISTKFSQIDEINISKKEPKIFDDVELDPIIINGLSGTGSIEETITKNDLTGALDLTFNVKHSNGKTEDITNRINSAALQNGDIVTVTIKKGESFITRTIKITSLKIGLIDFFNSSDPNISASRKIVMDKIKEEIGGLLPKIGESFTQLSDAFKEYIGTKTALRKKTDKLKLAKEIFASKDTIDNQVFDKIAESKDSIINILVEELYKNNIFLNSISKDGSKIKDGIKSEINDLLDIFKVIVDHTLEFLGNSIYWEKEWNKKENFVAKTSTLDSKITELISAKPINGSKESSDLKFLKKLKVDGNFFASKEEQKNSIFKTTNELMKDNSKEYEIYREAVKDKKGNIIKGEFIYHIIKDVNARKITNTFKKNFNYTEFKKHGTLDNFGIIKGEEADNLIGGILDRAKERQKKDWKNIDLKDISLKELYKKHVSDGKDASTHTSNKGMDFTSILPMIKSVLSGNSISNILSAAGEEGGKLLGVNGIENIPEMFNSFTNSGSDVLIGVENNMFALLTYLIGDKAQIVIDIKENTDGTLKLDNYYSPQIRVIDKANNDKITYRKDNLDKFFNRLKPFMDLVYEFLGAKGK